MAQSHITDCINVACDTTRDRHRCSAGTTDKKHLEKRIRTKMDIVPGGINARWY